MKKMSKKSGSILMAVILTIYGLICASICFDLSLRKIRQRIAAKLACRCWAEEAETDEYYQDENGVWHARPFMNSEFEAE